MYDWTGSYDHGHGFCCRPESTHEYCVTGPDFDCSQPVQDPNPSSSSYMDILSPNFVDPSLKDINK